MAGAITMHTSIVRANGTYGDGSVPEPCGYIVPDDVKVTEETFSEFQDTYSGNAEVVGINLSPVSCSCGKYTDLTLRHEGTLLSLMQDLLEDK